jgi:acetyl-CoA carboxylase carboxyl transferase subunit beta
MAWFRKDKKPRSPRRERLEIPADAWEKCESCGYTDITEKFVRNLNVCPNCGYHRRIRAWDYANIFLDEGTAEETEVEIRSADPLAFPEYTQRLKKASGSADLISTSVSSAVPSSRNMLA